MVLDFSNGTALIIHLRVTGQLIVENASGTSERFPCIELLLDNNRKLVLYDKMRSAIFVLTSVDEVVKAPAISKLGPEYLSRNASKDGFIRTFTRCRRAIHTALLDQTLYSGLGNIYANEALFRASVYPKRRGSDIDQPELSRLYDVINDILRDAIAHGGTTFSSFKDALGNSGTYQSRLAVFRRKNEPCIMCHTAIRRIPIAGRGAFYCPACQQ